MSLSRGWGMRQSVTIAARTSQDVHGVATYSTSPTTYRARVVGKRRRVLDKDGQQVISSQTVYLATGDMVLPTAKVTLSTADAGSTESHALTPPIIATGRYPDQVGRNIYTALFLK